MQLERKKFETKSWKSLLDAEHEYDLKVTLILDFTQSAAAL